VNSPQSSGPILIVEDDADSRLMLATILALNGYRTVSASNGVEALAAAHHHHPCVILLDLHMPVMDGEGFRREQLAEPALKDIPVVLITAHNDGLAKAQALGVTCCIAKPLQVGEVLSQVAKYCPAHTEELFTEAQKTTY
jgi:CheY-like chemotaxis protein